jgi:hypothetical protein
MASRQLTSGPPRSSRAWQIGLLPSIPVALAVGYVAAGLGSDWRQTLMLYPTDQAPGAALFATGIIAALAMLFGLALLVSMDFPIGAWVFAFGVSMIAGAAIGFVIGPPPELVLAASWLGMR